MEQQYDQKYDQNEYSTFASEIMEYVHVFWAWAWLIILAGILAAGAAFVYSMRSIPIYQTSTRLLISQPPISRSIDYSSMVDSYYITETYAEMLVDRPVLEGVIETLGLATTPGALKGQILVEIVRNTQLLVIKVTDTDPYRAAQIADTTATVFTDRINELQSQRYADTRENLAQQIQMMEQQIEETNRAIAGTSVESKLAQLETRLTEYRQLYSNLVTSYEEVRLAEAQTKTTIVISEPAAINTSPISPRTYRNTLLAGLLGMMLAAGFVFAINALDDTIKNPDEVRRRFNLPLLGVIASHKVPAGKPISEAQPRSPVAESFRALRTNLTYSLVDKPLQRVMVTSPTPQLGKSTVLSNLAVVLIQSERKVVVLDADLRRPQIHRIFNIQNSIGLSNLFLRDSDVLLYGVVQMTSSNRLAVIPAGGVPPNPSELLTSKRMLEILVRLNQDYELILVDSPPVLTVTDAAALAPVMDGVIIVAKPGVTKIRELEQTIEQLNRVGGRVLGVVLNEVNPRSRRYGYYYGRYYSKYGYGYAENGKSKKSAKSNQKPKEKTAKSSSGGKSLRTLFKRG